MWHRITPTLVTHDEGCAPWFNVFICLWLQFPSGRQFHVPKVSQLFGVPQQANHGTPLVTLAAEAGTSEAEFLVAGVPPRPAGAALVDDWDCLRVGRRICQRLLPMCIGKSIAARALPTTQTYGMAPSRDL